ncbi:hypothetical protein TNCV_3955961 [Trichonephila clavipes]|nr:hypothetical protein TNCV_3955961 [Trichonephila clavipes]
MEKSILCFVKFLVAAVSEWYRYRIVAGFVTSSSPVPLKTYRVGQRCTLKQSRAETCSRWKIERLFSLLCFPITSGIVTAPEELQLEFVDLQSDHSVKDLGSSPGEDMDVCKCIVHLKHGGTLNNRRVVSPLVRLVEGEESGVTKNTRASLQSQVLGRKLKYVLGASQALGSPEHLPPAPQCGGVRYATGLPVSVL